MNHRVSRIARAIVILSLLIGASATVSSPAHADSGYGNCWQSSCNGKDPVNEYCDINAVTLSSISEGGYEIDLRYSPDCDSNWVRVVTATGEPFFVKNSNGDTAKYTSAAHLSSWSNMVNGYYHAWGCLRVPASTNDSGDTALWVSDTGNNGEAYRYPTCPSD